MFCTAPTGYAYTKVGSVVRSRGCSARCAYWNVNYFGVISAIAKAQAVVDHRERTVPSCQSYVCHVTSKPAYVALSTAFDEHVN